MQVILQFQKKQELLEMTKNNHLIEKQMKRLRSNAQPFFLQKSKQNVALLGKTNPAYGTLGIKKVTHDFCG